MDIEQRLRQLNRIEPNQVYARSSRARILTARPKLTVRGFVMGMLQSGSAIALTGILLLLVGGVVTVGSLVNGLIGKDYNYQNLRAEAEAIDIQIHLADVKYGGGSFDRESLIAAAPRPTEEAHEDPQEPAGTEPTGDPAEPGAAETPSSTDDGNVGVAATGSSTEPVFEPVETVEDALDLLSE